MLEKNVAIKSGECFVGENGESIFTTLGTCVAVCVFDRVRKHGGIIHYILPDESMAPHEGVDSVRDNPLNFGKSAIQHLLREMKIRGSRPQDLDVFLAGALRHGDEGNLLGESVARGNEQMALDQLKKYGLKVKSSRLGLHAKSLKLKFDLQSGEVFIVVGGEDKSAPKVTERSDKVRVLVVDDSPVVRAMLGKMLSQFPEIEVVAMASSAKEAEVKRVELKPDVMTLDIHMPEIDGVAYLAQIMKTAPMPVIMLSDLSLKEASPVMRALDLGAFEYVQKPSLAQAEEVAHRLRELLHAAKLAKATYSKGHFSVQQAEVEAVHSSASSIAPISSKCKLIAIGASTGGPEALKEVFEMFPSKTPPIVVVQHMPPVFTKAFAERLSRISQIEVREAVNGEELMQNTAYVAPGGQQMKVKERGGKFFIEVNDDAPVNRFKPSVDYLFNSVAQLSIGKDSFAALLTGMGDDGARGLLTLKNLGALTVAQNESTCVVYGMPKAAVERNAAKFVVPLKEVVSTFQKKAG
jgi:two-component system, chemotaxis family, protein-glutamate methylesterase/glutaminase